MFLLQTELLLFLLVERFEVVDQIYEVTWSDIVELLASLL